MEKFVIGLGERPLLLLTVAQRFLYLDEYDTKNKPEEKSNQH
jgi:hypothetical protein